MVANFSELGITTLDALGDKLRGNIPRSDGGLATMEQYQLTTCVPGVNCLPADVVAE